MGRKFETYVVACKCQSARPAGELWDTIVFGMSLAQHRDGRVRLGAPKAILYH